MENIKINGMSFLAGKWPLEKNNISIIFIHGSGLSKNLWVQQVDELSSYANTIAIDLPGHGESDGEACNRVEGYTKFVERIINELEITKPILCGLSMGGAVALHMILNPIMNYYGAVLLNTGAKLKVLPVILETIKNNYEKYIELSKMSLVSENADKGKITFLMDDIARCNPEAAYADFELCNNFDVMDQLSKIKIPVLVVTSGEDKMTPEKYGIYLSDHIDGSVRVHIEGAGHMVPIEKADGVNEAIAKFINNQNHQ